MNIDELYPKSRRYLAYQLVHNFTRKHDTTKRDLSRALGNNPKNFERTLVKNYLLHHGDLTKENFNKLKNSLQEFDKFIESHYDKYPHDCIDEVIEAYIVKNNAYNTKSFTKDEVADLIQKKFKYKSARWIGECLVVESK